MSNLAHQIVSVKKRANLYTVDFTQVTIAYLSIYEAVIISCIYMIEYDCDKYPFITVLLIIPGHFAHLLLANTALYIQIY